MKQIRLVFLLTIVILLLLGTACAAPEAIEASSEGTASTADEGHMDNDDHHDEDDHQVAHIHVAAPEEYAALDNPFADDHEAIEAGEETFNTLCATCHGEEGKGDGPGAAELDPKPADLSDDMMMSSLSDGYLFWRVSKGGDLEPFNSAMPAWESGLTKSQRWQVISYLRTLSDDDHDIEEDHMDDEHMEDDHAAEEHTEDDHATDEHMEDEHDG